MHRYLSLLTFISLVWNQENYLIDNLYLLLNDKNVGPGDNGASVTFGSDDNFDGPVHINGDINLSNFGCPEFLETVSYTGFINWGACDSSIFQEGLFNIDSIQLDVDLIDSLKGLSEHIVPADTKVGREGMPDTLVMTEINFVEGGYWVTQWWYQIPPIFTSWNGFEFTWVDPTTYPENSLALNEPNSARFAIPGTFEAGAGYDAIWFVISGND